MSTSSHKMVNVSVWGPEKKTYPIIKQLCLYLYVKCCRHTYKILRNAPHSHRSLCDSLCYPHRHAPIYIIQNKGVIQLILFLAKKAQNNVSDVQQRYVLYCMWKHVYSLRHKNLFRE